MNNRFLKISLILFIIIVISFWALYAALNTQYLRNYISVSIEKVVNSSIDQKFSIGKLNGNLFKGFELQNVKIEVEGEPFVVVKSLSTNYSLPLLASVILRGDIPLYNTEASGVQINLIKDKEGIWNFKKLKSPEKQEDDKEKQEGEDKGGLINIYLKDTTIKDSRLSIINREKDSKIEFDIHESDFSIDLIGLHRKFVLDSKNINLDIEPFGVILKNISTDALITKDNVAFKNLDLNLNGTHIQGQGIINNYSNPEFNINTYIDSFTPSDIGVFNFYVKASGKSWDYKRFDAELEVSLLNSQVRGRRIWTDLQKIEVKDTRAFLNGDINTEFGSASVDGFLDFKEILQKEGYNEFNIDTEVSELNLNELLNVLEIRSENINLAKENTIRSAFVANGKWAKGSEFTTNINFSELKLFEGTAEKITLTGQTLINKKKMDLDIQSSIRNLDLSEILTDFDRVTDINTDIFFYGSIPLNGNFLDNLQFNTTSEIFTSTINDLTIDKAVVDSNYNNGILNVNELEVFSSDLSLSVEGMGSRENGLDLIYKVKSKELEFLSNIFSDTGLSGSIEADGTIIGDIKNPKLTTIGTFENLRYKEVFYTRSGDINLTTFLNSDLEGLDITSNLKNIRLAGRKIELLQLLASREGDRIVSNITSVISEDRTMIASVTINDLLEKNKVLRFNTLEMSLKENERITTEPFVINIGPDSIGLNKPTFKFKDGYMLIDGYYSFGNELNLKAELNNIDNSIITLLTGSDKMYTGTTSGNLSIRGSVNNPAFNADIQSSDPGIDGYSMETISLGLNARNRNINIDIMSSGPEVGDIGIKGSIRTDLALASLSENINKANMDLDISSSNFDISLFQHYVEEITELKGVMNTDIKLGGKINEPELNGEIKISDSEIRVKSISNTLLIEQLTIIGNNDSARISPTVIKSGEGQATLTGEMDIDDLTYSISLDLDKLLVKPKFITTNLSGKLDITGDENNRIKISGDLDTKNTRITIVDKQSKEVKEIKFVDESEEPDEFILSEDGEDSFYTKNVALDLDISIPRDSWVKGKGANIEITGDINVDKNYNEDHEITGNIDVVRGQYIVFGKLFKIDDGSITFPADGSITPLLDLNVSYDISNVEVFINVRGKADQPKLDLSSSPPMEESDIVSYILFGTSRNNLGNEQRNVAGEIASNIAAGEVANFIGGRFGLDVLSVQGGEEGGLSDPQIKAGSYINPDIYIGYERSSSTYPGSENTTYNSFILEWKINESFSLESQVGGENSGVDIFYNFNF